MRFIGKERAETHSVIMRAQSRTIRYVRSIHFLPGKEIPDGMALRKNAASL